MAHGYNLLTTGSPKTSKGEKLNYLTGVLYMVPATLGGFLRNGTAITLCPMASAGCMASCLVTAGRAGITNKPLMANGLPDNTIIAARLRRTALYVEQRDTFLAQLADDVERLIKQADRKGMQATLRVNGTSDLPWWRWKGFGAMVADLVAKGELVTYDYTKVYAYLNKAPAWHDLTLSRSETNQSTINKALSEGHRVAAVFAGKPPAQHLGYPVLDGDEHDLCFLHPGAHILGLKAKGRAKKDNTGFTIRDY